MNRVLILASMLALFVASQPADAQSRAVELEVTIGEEQIESINAVFSSFEHIPPTTLAWVAPVSSIRVAVDGDTPMRVVEDTRQALQGAGIQWIRFESSDDSVDPGAWLEATGRITVPFGAPEIADLSGELEPVLSELLPSSVVLFDIADEAPARLFMGVQEALRGIAVTYTRIYRPATVR